MESDKAQEQLIDEAVEHIAAMEDDTTGEAHQKFADWVRAKPAHVAAFLIATSQLRELARWDSSGLPTIARD